jgi:hypothetical protein
MFDLILKKSKIALIRNLLDFSRSCDKLLPGSFLHKRQGSGNKVETFPADVSVNWRFDFIKLTYL